MHTLGPTSCPPDPRRRPALPRHVADGQPRRPNRADRGARLSQLECFAAAVAVRPHRRHRAGAGILRTPITAAIDEALRCKREGKAETILFNLSGHGHFDMGAYTAYFAGQLKDEPTIRAPSTPPSPSCPRWPGCNWRLQGERIGRVTRSRNPPKEDYANAGPPGCTNAPAQCYRYTIALSDLLKRTAIDADHMHGRPCVRGLRITVADILGLMSADQSRETILQEYPYLEGADIDAVLTFVARQADHPIIAAE